MIGQAEIDRLRLFHAAHFPNQPNPNPLASYPDHYEGPATDQNNEADGGDALGYYEDGVRRTLTDEQIQMFRHSEIQRLLNERRTAREKEERRSRKKARAKDASGAVEERKKRRFDDRPPSEEPTVDTLMYDDVQDTNADSQSATKKFLWPKIGGD